MQSLIHTGATVIVKIARKSQAEQTIGYATSVQYSVTQGQKSIFCVDSPFPYQISQGAGPSIVRGQISIYMMKGCTPEQLGLVSYRQDAAGNIFMANSEYVSLRIYDRSTGQLLMGLESMKVSDYTVMVRARSIVQCIMNFEGMFANPNT
jgi:hypothetical protein